MITLLLAAATLAAAAPAPAPPAVGVSTVVAAAQQRLFARCAPPALLDVGDLLTSAAGRADAELLTFGEVSELTAYSACRDLQGAVDGCAALDGLGGAAGAAAACRMTAINDRFIFAVLRGGDAASLCFKIFEAEGRRGPAVARGCEAAIAAVRAGNAPAACASLKRERLISARDDCADTVAAWEGNPQACAAIKNAAAQSECRERAALVAGLRDPARCGASPACGALSAHNPKACDGLLAGFSQKVCGRMGKAVAETHRLEAQEQERIMKLQLHREAEFQREAEAKARAEAVVKAKAEAEARAEAAAKAKMAAKAAKPQYQKGQPMRRSGDVKEIMERLEKGLPLKPVKASKPAKDAPPADEEAAPADDGAAPAPAR